MKLYAISGLGADQRVFQYLNLNYELIPVEWIPPKRQETLPAYACRLAQAIHTDEPFGILGVSFGGLVATEISKQLQPDVTILISSAETKHELRPIYRLAGRSNILNLIPKQLFDPPRALANWLFGTQNKPLLKAILDDTDLSFAKWAVNQLTNWQNTERIKNPTLKICGTKDQLIPPSRDKHAKLIQGGAHFMIVDRADEISELINTAIQRIH